MDKLNKFSNITNLALRFAESFIDLTSFKHLAVFERYIPNDTTESAESFICHIKTYHPQ